MIERFYDHAKSVGTAPRWKMNTMHIREAFTVQVEASLHNVAKQRSGDTGVATVNSSGKRRCSKQEHGITEKSADDSFKDALVTVLS